MADFGHDSLIDVWWHPETGVIILGEDMPVELIPDTPHERNADAVLSHEQPS